MKLCDYIRAFDGFEMPTKKPIDLMNLIEKFKFFFSMRKVGKVMRELGKLSVEEYLERFENPALKVALESLIPGYYSAFILPSSLATVMTGNGGRPSGGSKAMAPRKAKVSSQYQMPSRCQISPRSGRQKYSRRHCVMPARET